MPINCAVPSCRGNRLLGFSMHRVPVRNDKLRRKWLNAIGNWKYHLSCKQEEIHVCGKHFTDKDYRDACDKHLKKARQRRRYRHLKKGAVPSLNLPKALQAQLNEANKKGPGSRPVTVCLKSAPPPPLPDLEKMDLTRATLLDDRPTTSNTKTKTKIGLNKMSTPPPVLNCAKPDEELSVASSDEDMLTGSSTSSEADTSRKCPQNSCLSHEHNAINQALSDDDCASSTVTSTFEKILRSMFRECDTCGSENEIFTKYDGSDLCLRMVCKSGHTNYWNSSEAT